MCKEISNGGEACLALDTLVKWIKKATPEELEKVVAFVDECEKKAEGSGEEFMYENLWYYLTHHLDKKKAGQVK